MTFLPKDRQFDRLFILVTDATKEIVSSVLSQETDGREHVITDWSKCIYKSERKHCTTRKQLLAKIKAAEHCHIYAYGRMHKHNIHQFCCVFILKIMKCVSNNLSSTSVLNEISYLCSSKRTISFTSEKSICNMCDNIF